MPRMVEFELHGLKELDTALAQLPKATAKSALRTALRRVLKPVVTDAGRRAPRDQQGRIERSMVISTRLRARQQGQITVGGVTMYAGPTSRIAHLHEFGTVKMRARPFLRPAWDEHQREVMQKLTAEIWTMIARAAARLARQAEAGRLGRGAQRFFAGGGQ